MPYRSRLQRITEKRNFSRAIAMFSVGIVLLVLMAIYGVKGMAALAIFIDKIKFGDKGVEVMDKIPPAPPTIWADYAATNSAEIKIYALSEPNSKVFLFLNGIQITEATANKDGELVFSNIILKTGKNEFWSKALDNAGNTSNQSRSMNIVFTDKGPEIILEKPSDGQRFSGADNPIEVRGKTVTAAKVFVNSRLTIADGSGGFLIKLNLNEGENILKIKVADAAGNETNKEIKVYYQP